MGFFEEYFVDPIINGSGYNIYNTAVYALILIAAAFLTFKLLKRMKIEINDKFLFGVLPFVIMGGLVRAMQDAGVVQSVWFITPLIYVTIFLIAFASLIIAKFAEGLVKLPYYKIWFIIGGAVVLIFIVEVNVRSELALAAITILSVFWALLLIFVKKISERYFKKVKFFSWENTALLAVHLFDATTTFVALTYFPYFEEHVLPSFLIGLFGPAVMFLLKAVVVSVVLYVIDGELKKDSQQRKFLKLVILILGLAPGLRNFFRLVMGV